MAKLCSCIETQKKVQALRQAIIHARRPSGFPIFEEYAALADKFPFYAYDNPAFLEVCDTAFTDSRAIYFAKDFINECFEHDRLMREQGISSRSALFLSLHEIKHIFEEDFAQIFDVIPHDIVNIGQDIHNNLDLRFNLDIELDPSSPLAIGYGLTTEELAEFGGKTSNTIVLDLFRRAVNQKKAKQQNQQGQQSQSSQQNQQAQSGQQSQSSQQNQQAQQNQQNQQKGGSASMQDKYGNLDSLLDGKKDKSQNHVISPQQLNEMAEKGQLDQKTKDRLGAKPRTDAELKQIEEQSRRNVVQAMLETEAAHQKLTEDEKKETSAGTASGHYRGKVRLGDEGKITWRAYQEEMAFLGAGTNFQYTEDVLYDGFYTNSQLYDGIIVPEQKKAGIAITLVDTSGSMNKGFIYDGFTESIHSVKQNEGSGLEEVLIFPADVNIANQYWILNESNIAQVMDEIMHLGGGGTDFTIPLLNALRVAEEQEKQVMFCTFFTDLDCCPPNFDYILNELGRDELPPVIFVTDKQSKAEIDRFNKQCGEYATVFQYDKGLEIELDAIKEELEEISDNKMKLGM